MATLIDWRQLESKVELIESLYEYETRSMALAHVMLDNLFELSPEEISDSITDGSQDRGIDAVHIEEAEKPVVHLFQFKYNTKFESAKNNFPSGEIDKILSFISDLLSKEKKMQDNCNPLLWANVQSIWELFDSGEIPSFVIHLCGNMAEVKKTELERLKTSLKPYKYFDAKSYSLKSIASLIIEKNRKQIDGQIHLVDKQYFERVDGNIRGLIATLPATELISLIQNPDEPEKVVLDVFNDNVRVYLGTKKNPINKKIFDSALERSAEFWYFNNGITITCDSFDYPPGTRSPVLNLKNFQIVNGGQTSNALFEAYKADKEKLSNTLLLVRVYETKEREVSQKIAETTNSQTPIRSRDLHSNDEIQKKLAEEFSAMGYFYERKTNQFKEKSKKLRIDALTAGQTYLAYHLDFPEVAKKDRGRIFGDIYEMIFNTEITAKKLLVPLEIFIPIDEKKKNLLSLIRKNQPIDSSELVFLDGNYHVLYAVSLICKKMGVDPNSSKDAIPLIDKAADVIKKVVKRLKNGQSKREHRLG